MRHRTGYSDALLATEVQSKKAILGREVFSSDASQREVRKMQFLRNLCPFLDAKRTQPGNLARVRN
jgi:hypothetical protein